MLASRQATSPNTAPHSGGRRLGRHAAMMETIAVTLCLLRPLCLNVFIPIFIYRFGFARKQLPTAAFLDPLAPKDTTPAIFYSNFCLPFSGIT